MDTHFDSLIAALPGLAKHPRAALFSQPTVLEPLPRLGRRLGVTLDAKRDDSLPLGMGGNKVRQLEFYLGEALSQQADTVLITGAVQSNFVRTCAAAARKLGLDPVIQLEERVARQDIWYRQSGNVLLDRMFGAEIVTFPEGENEAAADANLERLADQMRDKGKRPYVVHLGLAAPPVGGLGYAAAAVELFLQYQAQGAFPDWVVIPSGSGLTHAGFLAGARAIGWDVAVLGICVRRDATQQQARVRRRVDELSAMLASASVPDFDGPDSVVPDSDVIVTDTVLAPGYGQMNDAVAEAIRMAARQEALLLDPVYSGRAMAGLIDVLHDGRIPQGAHVCFLHTGGLPALFAYHQDLATL